MQKSTVLNNDVVLLWQLLLDEVVPSVHLASDGLRRLLRLDVRHRRILEKLLLRLGDPIGTRVPNTCPEPSKRLTLTGLRQIDASIRLPLLRTIDWLLCRCWDTRAAVLE